MLVKQLGPPIADPGTAARSIAVATAGFYFSRAVELLILVLGRAKEAEIPPPPSQLVFASGIALLYASSIGEGVAWLPLIIGLTTAVVPYAASSGFSFYRYLAGLFSRSASVSRPTETLARHLGPHAGHLGRSARAIFPNLSCFFS